MISAQPQSARYRAAAAHVLQIEGGFVDDPKDRGGATQFGISLRFLASEGAFDANGDGNRDFDLDMDGDIDRHDVRALTRDDAIALYHRCFWLAMDCENFPAPLGEMLFDQAVNGGRQTARKLLQRAINTCLLMSARQSNRPALLTVDGVLGQKSREAMVWVLRQPSLGSAVLCQSLRDAAAERYRAIVRANPSQKRFLKGWLARAARLGRVA